MEITFENYKNKYISTGSEIMILNAPVITTELLQEIKKTKRIYILENKIYDVYDKKGIMAFIDAIASFEFKLFHIFYGVIDVKLSETTIGSIKNENAEEQ